MGTEFGSKPCAARLRTQDMAAAKSPVSVSGFPAWLEHVKSVLPPLPDVQVEETAFEIVPIRSPACCVLLSHALAQIEFEDVSYSVQVPVRQHVVKNMATALVGMVTPKETKTRVVLSKCSGVLSPGTLTLVRYWFS